MVPPFEALVAADRASEGLVRGPAVSGRPSLGRTSQRNGHRHRELDTRAHTIDVAITKLRPGPCFRGLVAGALLSRGAGSDQCCGDLPLLGVSTLRMDRLVESLGISGLSRSRVSVIARDMDELVCDCRERSLNEGTYTFGGG
ncbi:transposase [Kribbella sp. NBC_00359]|uniref:transposase n=1 Tax=Kribbella sp. NBC_00359 TaxID=2975966 RepID=UPI003FA5C733